LGFVLGTAGEVFDSWEEERARRAVKRPEPASREAKLSEILAAARAVLVVRMTRERVIGIARGIWSLTRRLRTGADLSPRERGREDLCR